MVSTQWVEPMAVGGSEFTTPDYGAATAPVTEMGVAMERRATRHTPATGTGHAGFDVGIDPDISERDAFARRDFTCYPRYTSREFVEFLALVVAAHPNVELHVVCDNYAIHKHPNVKAWLAENPRVTLHFTPPSCSWLNMVEILFGIITKQAIRHDPEQRGHASHSYSGKLQQ